MEKIYEPSMLEIVFDKIIDPVLGKLYYKNFIKDLNLTGDEKIIDFGTGSGICSNYVAKTLNEGQGELVCVDVSKRWQKIARRKLKKYRNTNFELGNMWELDIKKEYYDIVLIHFVLHDVESSNRIKVINCLKSKLKENGKIIIREPIKMSHGIRAKELREIMLSCGLKENKFKTGKQKIVGEVVDGIYEK